MKTQITHDTALMRSLGLALATLLFSACATHAPRQGSDAGKGVAFPEAAKASPRGGVFVNLDNLRQYARGMSKRQLYGLLGTPHFNEGMWGVREWNYLFNFRSQPNGDYFSCQFQVHFDRNGIAQESFWKPQSCAAMLQAANAASGRGGARGTDCGRRAVNGNHG